MPLSHGAGRNVESPQSHRARTEPICHGATETESTKIFATEPQSTNLFATESQRHRDTDVRENVGEDPFTDGRHRRREERRAHGADLRRASDHLFASDQEACRIVDQFQLAPCDRGSKTIVSVITWR